MQGSGYEQGVHAPGKLITVTCVHDQIGFHDGPRELLNKQRRAITLRNDLLEYPGWQRFAADLSDQYRDLLSIKTIQDQVVACWVDLAGLH